MTPLVTVGICVRNGEKMLPAAVDSILGQDYPQNQIQIIFVDDGSIDRTPQIINDYAKRLGDKVKAYKSSWKGLGPARNLIVNMADGEYLLFVDCDEILTPSYIKAQVEAMQHNPRLGITAGVFKTVPNNFILNLEVAPNIVNQKSYGKPKNFIWKTEKLIGTGGTTFRTQAIRQVHGFDENIKGAGEDTDLVLRIKKAGWLLQPNSAELYELHSGLSTPYSLWKKYYWYGYGCQRSFKKTQGAFSLPRMTPIAGIVTGLMYSFPAYKFLRQKQMFLLPLHYGLKLTAWTAGFMKGQL
ncbi:MAG TPA: glycosyltransferase, partial [Candidatus Acidoferrales bacterium]|nr:glycosyltransferase [Candidatus Acidoferrales bacterium]